MTGLHRIFTVALLVASAPVALGQVVRDSLLARFTNAASVQQKISTTIDFAHWYMMEDFSKARELAASAVRLSERAGPEWQAKALTLRAEVYWRDGQYDSSILLNRKSILLRRALQDTVGLAENEFAIAMCYYYSADYDSAIAYDQRAYEGYTAARDVRSAAEVLNLIGMAYHLQGNYPKTIDYLYRFAEMRDTLEGYNGRTYNLGSTTPYFMSGTLFRDELKNQFTALQKLSPSDEVDRLSIYLNIADCYKELRDYPNALRYHKIAAAYATQIGVQPERTYIGNAYRALGLLDSALLFHREALDHKASGSQLQLLYTYGSLGKDLVERKDFSGALQYYQKALSMTRAMNNKLDVVIQELRIAETLASMHLPKAAEPYGLDALHLSVRIGAMTYVRDANMLMSRLKAAQDEFDSAYYYQSGGRLVADSLVSAESKLQYAQMQAQFESEQREKDIATLNYKGEVQARELRNKNLILGIAAVFLFLAVLMLLYIYLQSRRLGRSNRTLNLQKTRIELLLSEIHHRVKNNLQVISSLLSLQAMKLSSKDAKTAVLQGQSRVQAMGLIHESIYKSENLSYIRMDDYLGRLAGFLCESFSMREVSVGISAEEVSLDPDTAIPLGLIVNELITNSLKHAFHGASHPRIEIAIRPTQDGRLVMTVSDNGKGFNGAMKQNSFGLKLVKDLATQLGGSLEFESVGGMKASVYVNRFSLDPLQVDGR